VSISRYCGPLSTLYYPGSTLSTLPSRGRVFPAEIQSIRVDVIGYKCQ
jgi:hypothetical protein